MMRRFGFRYSAGSRGACVYLRKICRENAADSVCAITVAAAILRCQNGHEQEQRASGEVYAHADEHWPPWDIVVIPVQL